jgi:hypothetical protein
MISRGEAGHGLARLHAIITGFKPEDLDQLESL